MQGVKLVLRSENGSILGKRGEIGYDLPSSQVGDGEDLRAVSVRFLKSLTGSRFGNLIPSHRGPDEEWYVSSSYLLDCSEGFPVIPGYEWVQIQDILLGRWGLFARDIFNDLKLMNRPKLRLEDLYRISKKAQSHGSEFATDGIDIVVDEVAFLLDVKKEYAIDALLEVVDLKKLHADIIYSLKEIVEEIPFLRSKSWFIEKAEARIEEIDGPRRKIKLKNQFGEVVSEDVRGDALKYYRKKAREFGEMLRAGTLGSGLHRGGQPLPKSKKLN